MSKNLTVKLNRAGVREMLRSDEMVALLAERANAAASSLGDGYEVNTFIGKNRANAEIVAVSDNARRENLENNTILKALK